MHVLITSDLLVEESVIAQAFAGVAAEMQLETLVEPVLTVTVPTGHAVHAADPSPDLYVFKGHKSQAKPLQYFPAEQGRVPFAHILTTIGLQTERVGKLKTNAFNPPLCCINALSE